MPKVRKKVVRHNGLTTGLGNAPEKVNRFRAAYKKSMAIMQDAVAESGAKFPGNQATNRTQPRDLPPPLREEKKKAEQVGLKSDDGLTGLDTSSILGDIAWSPQAGPQTALLTCPIEDIFFGGARGGGKSDALLGDWLMHRMRYGGNCRGILFRRTYTELEELIQRSLIIYPATGGDYHKAEHTWYWPDGSLLRMRYLEADEDAARYQGFSFCVAVGTPVLMADSSWKPIESISIGDKVMTLEGPRSVTFKVNPYLAPGVKATVYDYEGQYVGEQLHPEWHPILALDGVADGSDPLTPHTLPQVDLSRVRQRGTPEGSWERGGPDAPGWISWSGVMGNDYRESSGLPQEPERPQELIVPVVLHAPTLRLVCARSDGYGDGPTQFRSQRKSFERWWETSQEKQPIPPDPWLPDVPSQLPADHESRSPHDGDSCGQPERQTPQGSLSSCSPCCGQYDGPLPLEEGTCQGEAPSLGDAGAPTQASHLDGAGTIPSGTRLPHAYYRHLYSGEERRLSEAVEPGIAILSPCGDLLVADITVEGANHYITSSGIINAQTWMGIDEIGNFPSPKPIDMLWATLRSAAGIPCVRRSTGNPGGPGTQWIKERYIDPSDPWVPFKWAPIKDRPDLTIESVFIPSRLEDNARLMALDPRYESRLAAINDPEMFRAWREGDWGILAGRYFTTFTDETCVVEPPFLPAWLPRWISIDWGFAHKSAVYWAAYDGERVYVYDEMLIDQHTPIDLAKAIVRRTKINSHSSKISRVCLSPDAFSRRSSTKTIAMEISSVVPWPVVQADNDRIGGWNLMRQMFAFGQLKISSVCQSLIKKLKVAQRDPKRPEDVLKCEGDDEIDSLRYLIKTADMRVVIPTDVVINDSIKKYQEEGDYMNAFIEKLRLMDAAKKQKKVRPIRGRF